jgi:hypothetical protein
MKPATIDDKSGGNECQDDGDQAADDTCAGSAAAQFRAIAISFYIEIRSWIESTCGTGMIDRPLARRSPEPRA